MISWKWGKLTLQETKWVKDKAKKIVGERQEHRLWCSGQNRIPYRVGVIMDERASKDEVEVCRKNDINVRLKIGYGKKIVIIISAYALQYFQSLFLRLIF